MSRLSGPEIRRAVQGVVRDQRLYVSPFDDAAVGPTSVDLRLGPVVKRLDHWPRSTLPVDDPLAVYYDTHALPGLVDVPCVDGSFYLEPGVLYLASTRERVALVGLCGLVLGRSTTARWGISVEISAGFIDDGFGDEEGEDGEYGSTITLEVTVVHPVRVYPGDRICQLALEPVIGERQPYGGPKHHYQGQVGPRGPSSLAD